MTAKSNNKSLKLNSSLADKNKSPEGKSSNAEFNAKSDALFSAKYETYVEARKNGPKKVAVLTPPSSPMPSVRSSSQRAFGLPRMSSVKATAASLSSSPQRVSTATDSKSSESTSPRAKIDDTSKKTLSRGLSGLRNLFRRDRSASPSPRSTETSTSATVVSSPRESVEQKTTTEPVKKTKRKSNTVGAIPAKTKNRSDRKNSDEPPAFVSVFKAETPTEPSFKSVFKEDNEPTTQAPLSPQNEGVLKLANKDRKITLAGKTSTSTAAIALSLQESNPDPVMTSSPARKVEISRLTKRGKLTGSTETIKDSASRTKLIDSADTAKDFPRKEKLTNSTELTKGSPRSASASKSDVVETPATPESSGSPRFRK